jgi:hypothetical protein
VPNVEAIAIDRQGRILLAGAAPPLKNAPGSAFVVRYLP